MPDPQGVTHIPAAPPAGVDRRERAPVLVSAAADARSRRSRWVGVAVMLVLAGGCAQHVTGVPAAAPAATDSAVPSDPTSVAAPAEDTAGGCRVTVAAGSIRMSGGGRVRTINGAHQFACRNGPLVAIESVEAGGVRFRVDAASVLVAADATGQVGPYRITVRELDAPAAEFAVVPAG
jgi:hypothetical protein